MRLMLLRHAKAEKGAPGTRDRDRELAARGRKDAPRMGAYMARQQLIPNLALISPARRTRETWEGLAGAFPALPTNFEDRLYASGPEEILAAIRETDAGAMTLLVIGHNPGLHETARLLIASGDVATRELLNEGMPTSGLAVIDFALGGWERLHPHSGRLERFVSPKRIETQTD